MSKRSLSTLSLALAGLWHTLPSLAQDSVAASESAPPAAEATEDRALSFQVGGGMRYDSNVALLDLDTSTNAGDAIRLLNFGLSYDLPTSGRFGFTTGYNLSDSRHEDFEAFDVRLHRASATLSWDMGRTDVGAVLTHADARLDGTDFLTLDQVSPYVSQLVGDKLFIRFAYTDADKDFASNPLRAASAAAWSSDFYVFLNGLTTYLIVGLRIDDEDAIDPQFDYSGDRFRVQLSHRFGTGERPLTFRAGVRTESRDYSSITPAIGSLRQDDRWRFEAGADLPISESVTANFVYQHADNSSNLQSVDFDEDVVSVEFSATF